MANRILLGQRSSSEIGIFISKPGQNVLTASDSNLLLSTKYLAAQIAAAGKFTKPNGSSLYTLTIPDLGFHPVLLIYCPSFLVREFTYQSNTSVLIHFGDLVAYGDPNRTVSWAVLNRPME